MTAAIDSVPDPIVAALRFVCRTNINSRVSLVDADGVDQAVRATLGHPLDIAFVPAVRTPVLAIWRSRMQVIGAGTKFVRRASFRFDYVAPKTPRGLLDERWPLLNAVVEALFDSLRKGRYDGQSAAEEPLLATVGMREIDGDSWSTDFGFALETDQAWPIARTTVSIDYEIVPTTEYPLATELLAKQLRDDATAIVVESLHKTEAKAAADAVADDIMATEYLEED